ncbi:calcium/calmodulin-dependent protein kinase type 1G [Selaginella moellendorffii]|uniref:calcium/calmodulin-dependent protein kinase type 1G n=1 Tax=Selaginella moellendorffii TaxID=88036 RepID=UPI000D1C429D|nr:calcium/calmodulin-dependent protein kinase type 1G [Selaginella moellendorffii]|eukprot:XP_024545364.1 calcium/calmodulin-dependent protein kinase type 1G [Selaginella moellendorffii]
MVRQDVEFEDDDCAELLKIYTRGERLGCGSQGQVFVLKGATSYAGKMFRAGRDAGRELRLMSKLRGCAGVVSLAGFVKERSGGACYGTMVMELCGPSLFHRLIKGGPLGEEEAAKTIQRLAEALKGIHSSGIVHRDLKPENIFVKLDATAVHEVVIGDFGVATDDPKEMSQCCGTGKYMAPEVTSCKGDARSQSFYTAAIDVWALGVIAYELLRGYKQSREIELLRAGEFPDGCPLSDEAEDLICGMLAVEPSERLTLDGVLEHPWIVENCSSKTIQKRKRCGVKRSAPGFSSDLVVKKVRAA